MLWILAGLIAAIVAVTLYLDIGAPKTVVTAKVVSSQFQAERANSGRTLTTVEAADGQRWSISRPGRDTLSIGDVVQAEIVRGRVTRLTRE